MSNEEFEINESESLLFEEINKIRSSPGSYEQSFGLVAKAYSKFPNKLNISNELTEISKNLKKTSVSQKLEMSKGLSLAAKDVLHHIHTLGFHHQLKIDQEDLAKFCRKYTGEFKLITFLLDHGSIENMLARCMTSEYDPKREYKTSIFNKNYKFCGVASEEIEGEISSVIILADNIFEGQSKPVYDPEKYAELKEAFDLFDVCNIGKLDTKETKKAMTDLGYHVRNPVIYNIIDQLDTPDNYKGVDFSTFIDAILNNIKEESSKEGLHRIFTLYKDDPNSDILTLGGVKRIANELNEAGQIKEVNELLALAKTNGNVLSFEEFYNFMCPKEEEHEDEVEAQ